MPNMLNAQGGLMERPDQFPSTAHRVDFMNPVVQMKRAGAYVHNQAPAMKAGLLLAGLAVLYFVVKRRRKHH